MSTEAEPRRLGRYELRQRLGRGGMAEVWKAFDTQLQRYVAIKILHADLRTDPNFTTRFEREARLIAALHHPNIVQIYDFQVPFNNVSTEATGAEDGEEPTAYMIMDYVEGQTLAQYLHKTVHQGKFLPATELLHLFTPICQAIEYAHKMGMVHRDLKPANILLDKRNQANNPAGEPIISDFGISKMLDDQTQTQHGFWLGTPAYIAPEQVEGERTSERSDIYALAIILYEICTGTLPFQADGPIALAMQHVKGSPTPPNLINPGISQALADVIMQGMEKDPNRRFTTASALQFALTRALTSAPTETARTIEKVITNDEYATHAADEGAPTPLSNRLSQTSLYTFETEPSSVSGAFTVAANSPIPPFIATPDIIGSIKEPAALPIMKTSDAPDNIADADMPTIITNSSSPGASSAPDDIAPSDMPTMIANSGSSAPDDIASSDMPTIITKPGSPGAPFAPTIIPNPVASQNKQKKRPVQIALACLLIAALAGGAFLVLPHFSNAAQTGSGTLNFLNSGQYNPQGTAGITDEVQGDFTALPAPDAGKAYYAWLLSDANKQNQQSMLLGKLQINNGKGQLVFHGDANHSNILAQYSRFVLTMENASSVPARPGLKDTWRYYGEIPNIPIPDDIINHYSLLDHMRHLASEDPIMGTVGLHGGLNLWFGRNTEKLLESATSARDELNAALVHRQIVRSLDYLDGSTFSKVDVPAGTPFLIDPLAGQVGLLTFSQQQPLPGLLSHVDKHLQGLIVAPGVTDGQKKLANQLAQETQLVQKELEQARVDAKKLVVMDDTQLSQPDAHTLLNDLSQEVNMAYVGQRDATTGELNGGVEQISAQILHLSEIDIKPYISA